MLNRKKTDDAEQEEEQEHAEDSANQVCNHAACPPVSEMCASPGERPRRSPGDLDAQFLASWTSVPDYGLTYIAPYGHEPYAAQR